MTMTLQPGRRMQAPARSIPNGIGFGINLDAWMRQKVVLDKSLLHGLFTESVPAALWYEEINGIELASMSSNVNSVNGKLSLKSGTTTSDSRILRSFRSPRYEPNRGILYSSSLFFPNPIARGIRDAGFFTRESGVFFRLKDGFLYACSQTKLNGVIQPVREEKINNLPPGFKLENGNTYDIQAQWRGVGDYGFWISDEQTRTSYLAHVMKNLNKSTELSTWNPATPLSFRCINTSGVDVEIQCGCVDLTSEGGEENGKTYGSIPMDTPNGRIGVTGFNQPMIIIRVPKTFNGNINTRDHLALGAEFYANARGYVSIWGTRDATSVNLGSQSWVPMEDGHLEYIIVDPTAITPASIDTAKAVRQWGTGIQANGQLHTSAVYGDKGPKLYITPGDYLFLCAARDTGNAMDAGATLEIGRSI